jgi:hypothetical protein
MKRRLLITTMVVVALVGCSSSETQTPPTGSSGSSSGSSGSSGTSGAPDTTSSGGQNTSGAAAPKAPTLDQVAKMSGGLHVMWTNPADGCDSVEGERKATMAGGIVHEEYKVAFTVPGEADNKHDVTATDDMDYAYRLRCKKGDKYSPYSNEMTKNPTK